MLFRSMLMYWLLSSAMRRVGSNMAKGGGMGNFMQFGQSGAKVYAENDIKTRFSDVAGQDEAKDGLLHISQIANERVNQVSDYLKEGQQVRVKVIDADEKGRVRLSMKALLNEEAAQ